MREIRIIIASIGESSSYRFVGGCCRYLLQRGSRDEVSISARRDYAGATNNPRSSEMHLEWKMSKRRTETPTVLVHSVPRSLSVAGESELRTRQSYTREKAATIGSVAPCTDAPWHEYECPERTTEVREVGIRIPGHIRPSPASPRV